MKRNRETIFPIPRVHTDKMGQAYSSVSLMYMLPLLKNIDQNIVQKHGPKNGTTCIHPTNMYCICIYSTYICWTKPARWQTDTTRWIPFWMICQTNPITHHHNQSFRAISEDFEIERWMMILIAHQSVFIENLGNSFELFVQANGHTDSIRKQTH